MVALSPRAGRLQGRIRPGLRVLDPRAREVVGPVFNHIARSSSTRLSAAPQRNTDHDGNDHAESADLVLCGARHRGHRAIEMPGGVTVGDAVARSRAPRRARAARSQLEFAIHGQRARPRHAAGGRRPRRIPAAARRGSQECARPARARAFTPARPTRGAEASGHPERRPYGNLRPFPCLAESLRQLRDIDRLRRPTERPCGRLSLASPPAAVEAEAHAIPKSLRCPRNARRTRMAWRAGVALYALGLIGVNTTSAEIRPIAASTAAGSFATCSRR